MTGECVCLCEWSGRGTESHCPFKTSCSVRISLELVSPYEQRGQ